MPALSALDLKVGSETAISSIGASQPVLERAKFVINGRFLCQQVTGVQRVAREVTLEIDRLLGTGMLKAEVELLCPIGSDMSSLDVKHIDVRAVGRATGFWWEQFVLPYRVRGRTLLCLGNSAPIALLLGGAKVGVIIHDLSYLDFPAAYRRRYRWGHRMILPLLLRRARHLFTVSHTERKRLIALRPSVAERTVVAPNGGWSEGGMPAETCQPIYPAGYALYVGSLSHRKNFDRILLTAIRLAREDGIPFVFVGSTGKVLREPNMQVPDDVVDMIHFAGQIEKRSELAEIYRGARILVFPSLYEASPLPPLEAAHFNCPVVASNIPSMWERCGEGVTYCDPLSVDSIVSAVRKSLDINIRQSKKIEINGDTARRMSWADQARKICECLP